MAPEEIMKDYEFYDNYKIKAFSFGLIILKMIILNKF